MPIIEPCFRPPSEAESILLQITLGCSCNTCAFCGAYKDKRFRIKPVSEIFSDIDYYSACYSDIKKLFLMDGDALVVNNAKLIPILDRVSQKLPRVIRVSSYANGFNITDRTSEELRDLSGRRLKLIYLGLESGCQEILDWCGKKSTVRH
jgi:radical SAM superfamily enzyme YgiQ (UPF0313 family)